MNKTAAQDVTHRLAALVVIRRPLGAIAGEMFSDDDIRAMPAEVRRAFRDALAAENALLELLNAIAGEYGT